MEPDEIMLDHDEHFRWHILHVMSTKEFVIRDKIKRLNRDNIKQIFIPVVAQMITVRNTKQLHHETIFSGYIFLLAELDEKTVNDICAIQDVFYFLGQYDDDRLPDHITDIELQRLRRGLNLIFDTVANPSTHLNKGDFVRISTGVFRNLKGMIKEIKNNKLILEIDDVAMSNKIAITVDVSDIEK